MSNVTDIPSKYLHVEMIQEVVTRLIKTYQPVAIYLFGSYAWGEPNKDSDIDFFIIINTSNLNKADRIRIGLTELMDIRLPVDILVFTRDEVEAQKYHPSTLTHKVISRGVKLYEAA
jgi:predicted nucleotidyltransferase